MKCIQQKTHDAAAKLRLRIGSGFTIIELLVVISLMAILGGMSLVALRGAQQDAFVAKTRATIRKIQSIIDSRYEQYRYMDLDYVVTTGSEQSNRLPVARLAAPTVLPIGGESDGVLHSRIRLQLVRDLMRMELPDCPGDVFALESGGLAFRGERDGFLTGYTHATAGPIYVQLKGSAKYGQLSAALLQRIESFHLSQGRTSLDPFPIIETNFNAELLFLVVEQSYVAGSYGIEAFGTSEIADTDNDGMRELIDAWGNPIQWLRWPAGYYDDPLISQEESLLAVSGSRALVSRYNPDPFANSLAAFDDLDPTNSDYGFSTSIPANRPTGPLRPLIISPGPDGQTGLRFFWTGHNERTAPAYAGTPAIPSPLFSSSDVVWDISQINNAYSGVSPALWPDPYNPRPPNVNGEFDDDHNHALGGVLNLHVDGEGSTLEIPVGVVPTGFNIGETLEGTEEEVNAAVLALVGDNITNFDETGGSL